MGSRSQIFPFSHFRDPFEPQAISIIIEINKEVGHYYTFA